MRVEEKERLAKMFVDLYQEATDIHKKYEEEKKRIQEPLKDFYNRLKVTLEAQEDRIFSQECYDAIIPQLVSVMIAEGVDVQEALGYVKKLISMKKSGMFELVEFLEELKQSFNN